MRIARRAVQLRVAESARGASGSKIARSLQWVISLALLSFLAAMPAGTRVVVLVERGASIYLQARRGFEQGFTGREQVDLKFVDGDARELHAGSDGEAHGESAPQLTARAASHNRLPTRGTALAQQCTVFPVRLRC